MRVTLEDVGQQFGQREVLRGVTAVLSGPGLVSLMGPSGSGKSTLLAVISGLIRPARGTVRYSDGAEQPRIDWVFQTSPLLMRRTAQDNAALGALARGVGSDQAAVVALRALDDLAISHLARTRGRDLSGGERQRVAIARGMAADADLLLVDEPTAALDAESRNVVCRALMRAARSRLVVVATHDPYVADQSDTTFVISDGGLLRRKR